jgi:hypothetical protein
MQSGSWVPGDRFAWHLHIQNKVWSLGFGKDRRFISWRNVIGCSASRVVSNLLGREFDSNGSIIEAEVSPTEQAFVFWMGNRKNTSCNSLPLLLTAACQPLPARFNQQEVGISNGRILKPQAGCSPSISAHDTTITVLQTAELS